MSSNGLTWVADALVVLALVVMTVGVVGLRRMPDVYTQLHATSKAVFLGVIAVLAAAALSGEPSIIFRAVLIAAALVLTAPVAAHVVARAAYLLGEPMLTPGALDESGRDLPSAQPASRGRRRRTEPGRSVVVGYDGSDHARRALERAAAVARDAGTVTVVTAARVLPASPQAAGRSQQELREHQRVIEEATTWLAERGATVRVVDSIADPAQAIVEAARETGADLIVVGTRGRSAAARALLGSVSAEVVNSAPCEVEVV